MSSPRHPSCHPYQTKVAKLQMFLRLWASWFYFNRPHWADGTSVHVLFCIKLDTTVVFSAIKNPIHSKSFCFCCTQRTPGSAGRSCHSSSHSDGGVEEEEVVVAVVGDVWCVVTAGARAGGRSPCGTILPGSPGMRDQHASLAKKC